MGDGGPDDGLREQLAELGRWVTQAGLAVGSGGNLSARLPGSDVFWVTGAGTWLDRLSLESFARVRISDGLVVDSGGSASPATPTTELALHVASYRVRADVNVIVHLHPQMAVLLDSFGERIRLITTDHAAYVGRVATTTLLPPGTAALAEAAAAAIADGTNCVILAHHGCSVVGETIRAAQRRAANLEEAAQLTYRALVLTGALHGRDIAECPLAFSHGQFSHGQVIGDQLSDGQLSDDQVHES